MEYDKCDVPSNDELHGAQSQWVYRMLEDRMKAPIAKTIIICNKRNKNVLQIWNELSKALDKSDNVKF